MASKFYQICFSNINGWKTINASNNTPEDALKTFTSIQNANIGAGDDGIKEVGMQICCRDGYVFISKIVYGLRDFTNRSCHFAQCFCFDFDYICNNPVAIIKLSDDNFKVSAECDLLENVENTKDIPEELIFDSSEFAKKTYADLNISSVSQRDLIYSALKALCGTDRLYIGYDGSLEMFKSIASLFLSFLPTSLRRTISISTFEKSKNDKVIFTNNLEKNAMYYDLLSSDNNVLTERDYNKYSNVRFINHQRSSSALSYFCELDSVMQKLGISNTNNFENIRIADRILKYDADDIEYISDDEQIVAFLYSLLTSTIPHSDYFDNYVSCVLGMLISKEIELNDVVNSKLIEFVNRSSFQALKETVSTYQCMLIVKMDTEKAQKYLVENYTYNSHSFEVLVSDLLKSQKGQKLVDFFFAQTVQNICKNTNDLLELGELIRKLPYNIKSMNILMQITAKIFYETLPIHSDVEIEKMKKNIVLICGKEKAQLCYNAIVNKFWNEFDFLHLEKLDLNAAKLIGLSENENYKRVAYALKIIGLSKNKEYNSLINAIIKLNDDCGSFIYSEYEKNIIIKCCADICVNSQDFVESENNLTNVVILAVSNRNNEPPIEFVLRNRIKSLKELSYEDYGKLKLFSDQTCKKYASFFASKMADFKSENKEETKLINEKYKDFRKALSVAQKDVSKENAFSKNKGLGEIKNVGNKIWSIFKKS